MIGVKSMTAGERIKANILIDERGCWLWQGSILQKGYAMVRFKTKKVMVHRLAYEAFVGPIPEGMIVMHKCDVRRCCNPGHLTAGTQSDNMLDCSAKNRHPAMFKSGENHPLHLGKFRPTKSKLTDDQVREIRNHPRTHGSRKALMMKFGVSANCIQKIRSGESYPHLK